MRAHKKSIFGLGFGRQGTDAVSRSVHGPEAQRESQARRLGSLGTASRSVSEDAVRSASPGPALTARSDAIAKGGVAPDEDGSTGK